MAYDPNKDPAVLALRNRVVEVKAEAAAKAEQHKKDHALGLAKGQTPEQIEARKRVVAVFFEQHLPEEKPDSVEAFVARVDLKEPLVSMNARGIDPQNPKSRGLLGMGRKPAYVVSKQFPPKTDQDPVYALEYFPVKA